LSIEQRWRVIDLVRDSHLTIAATARKMSINRRTVTDILHKYHETGDVKDREGRGRKRKLTIAEEKKIIRKAKKRKNATEIAREYKIETKKSITPQTVRNLFHEQHLYWLPEQGIEELSERNKQQRLEYCHQMETYKWKNVLFSDEKTFVLNSGTTYSWQALEHRSKRSKRRHPPKLHVWGAIGYYYKSPLFFFTQNLDAELYRKILAARISEKRIIYANDCPARLKENWTFLQDNDPKHKAARTMQFLREKLGDRIIPHPASSPDLNVMEDMWSYLNRKVQAAKITTIQGLKRTLTKEWKDMPWHEVRVSVESMPRRLQECINEKGARTHY